MRKKVVFTLPVFSRIHLILNIFFQVVLQAVFLVFAQNLYEFRAVGEESDWRAEEWLIFPAFSSAPSGSISKPKFEKQLANKRNIYHFYSSNSHVDTVIIEFKRDMANSTPPHSHILMDEFSLGEEACSEEPLVDAEYSDEEYWSEYESTDEDEYEPLNNCELEALALITDWVENNVDSFSNKEAKRWLPNHSLLLLSIYAIR